MFKNILSFLVLIGVSIFFVLPIFVIAQATQNPNPGTSNPITQNIVINNPFQQNSIQGFIETIINSILIPIGGVVAVVMIIYAGFLYVTASGEPAKITQAHEALKWAVIGSAILLGAWVIAKAIGATIDQLKT